MKRKDDDPIIVLTTAADADELARLARTLVEERLAACVTIVPTVRSIYRWKGAVEDQPEALGVIKTTRRRYPAIEKRWTELHSYDVPELLVLTVDGGLPAYLSWLLQSTCAETGSYTLSQEPDGS
jgi:periplasmic divalent cation tolerance protein